LRGEQEPTATGFRWYVIVDDGDPPGTPADPPAGTSNGTSAGTPGTSGDIPAGIPIDTPAAALIARRAQELAAYTEELLAPWRTQVAELSQRVGRLEAELEHALANGQAQTQNGAPPAESWPEGRPWWQRLLFG
jgi:hypothetical protein